MKKLIFCIIAIIVLFACKKEQDPYTSTQKKAPVIINPADTIDPNSFVGLHNNIFKPTCANSGCHDGNFEPDYRTIESAYNTLVFQPVIKNTIDNRFQYRVKPGDAENSVLFHRLHTDIDGQSGIMPLVVDSGSDYNSKKDQYIQNVKNWINNGAKDMFGNAPTTGNLEPIFNGVIGRADTSNISLTRAPGKSSIIVPTAAQKLNLWFSFSDDDTQPGLLTYNKIKFSDEGFQFQNKPEQALVLGSPVQDLGYFDINVSYTHKIQLDMSAYATNKTYYFRVYVKDSGPVATEIPKSGSANYIKLYFSFIRK